MSRIRGLDAVSREKTDGVESERLKFFGFFHGCSNLVSIEWFNFKQ
jgi:hypothetical protein